jgi:uncharacterized protein YjbJ (UPF0337 family)
MNQSIAKGQWERLKGTLLAAWGKLTGDPLRVVAGRHQQIAGRLQVGYGVARRELARQRVTIERRARERRPA